MELMAMVLTNMRRPSRREMKAQNPTARAGVLFDESTRRNPENGRP
jgi:hypothetical protein